MLRTLSSLRSFSSSRALFGSNDLIKQAFLKKIRQYAQKQQAAGGRLIDSAEVQGMLEDELNRLANKFHLENAAAVRELPTNFDRPEVESSVQKILEGRNLDDMIAQVKKETDLYLAERKAKAEEAARRAALLQSDSGPVASVEAPKAA